MVDDRNGPRELMQKVLVALERIGNRLFSVAKEVCHLLQISHLFVMNFQSHRFTLSLAVVPLDCLYLTCYRVNYNGTLARIRDRNQSRDATLVYAVTYGDDFFLDLADRTGLPSGGHRKLDRSPRRMTYW